MLTRSQHFIILEQVSQTLTYTEKTKLNFKKYLWMSYEVLNDNVMSKVLLNQCSKVSRPHSQKVENHWFKRDMQACCEMFLHFCIAFIFMPTLI
jgi:hypothetical protein